MALDTYAPTRLECMLTVNATDGLVYWRRGYQVAYRQVLEGFLADLKSAGLPEIDEFRWRVVFEEVVNNAFVHGNLETGSELRASADSEAFLNHLRSITAERILSRPICITSTIQPVSSTEPGAPDLIRAMLRVHDEGRGFNPDIIADPTAAENIDIPSGRGIALMRAFTDELRFDDGGRTVTMTKIFPYREPQPAGESTESAST